MAGELRQSDKTTGEGVWTAACARAHVDDIARLPIESASPPSSQSAVPHLLPISRVAVLSLEEGRAQIVREDLQHMIAVTARLENRDLASAMRDVQATVASITEDVLVDLGLRRARPILMTSLVAILALLPLALRFGAGAEMQAPLAQAIIAGLVATVPLVLFVLPVVTAIFARTPHVTPTPATPATTNVLPTPISSPTTPTSTTTNESDRSTR